LLAVSQRPEAPADTVLYPGNKGADDRSRVYRVLLSRPLRCRHEIQADFVDVGLREDAIADRVEQVCSNLGVMRQHKEDVTIGILPSHTVAELGNPISASGRDLAAAVPALFGGFLCRPGGSYREFGHFDIEVGHEFGGPLGGHYGFVLACPSLAGDVQQLDDLLFHPFTLGIQRHLSPLPTCFLLIAELARGAGPVLSAPSLLLRFPRQAEAQKLDLLKVGAESLLPRKFERSLSCSRPLVFQS